MSLAQHSAGTYSEVSTLSSVTRIPIASEYVSEMCLVGVGGGGGGGGVGVVLVLVLVFVFSQGHRGTRKKGSCTLNRGQGKYGQPIKILTRNLQSKAANKFTIQLDLRDIHAVINHEDRLPSN